uniref:Mucin-1 n=1 Tax=Monodelphis domestica TaxID=13616 RepID=F6V355_MONDO
MANYEKTSGNRNKNNMNLSIRTPTVAITAPKHHPATTGNPKSISSTIHQIATSGPNNNHSSISQSITISQSTSHHPAVVIAENSMFFLSFRILSKNFNSSLENPSSLYYQELKNSLSDLVGANLLVPRMGSVVTDCILVFQEGSITASEVQNLFAENLKKGYIYNLNISSSDIIVRDWNSKTSSTGSSVPGYGIALLVIVCILASSSPDILGLCQFRRKHCGQLDIFPSQDSYHPMNEYPLYHTHGRYVPPGNTKRSPYEEVRLRRFLPSASILQMTNRKVRKLK